MSAQRLFEQGYWNEASVERAVIKRLSIWVGVFVVGLIATTVVALELGDVVTVETSGVVPSVARQTHVWFIAIDDKILLEAGNAQNPWVQDLVAGGELRLVGQGLGGGYSYSLNGPESHQQIRDLMRAKYGWRGWWISLIIDTTESTMIEIARIEA